MLSRSLIPTILRFKTNFLKDGEIHIKPYDLEDFFSHKVTMMNLDVSLFLFNKFFQLTVLILNKNNTPIVQIKVVEDELMEDEFQYINSDSLDKEKNQISDMYESEKELIAFDVFFNDPVFLENTWREIYHLILKETDNKFETSTITKEIFLTIESTLKSWILVKNIRVIE